MVKLSCDPYGRDEGAGADPQYSGRTLVVMRSPASEVAFRAFARDAAQDVSLLDKLDSDNAPYYPRFGIGVLPYSVQGLIDHKDRYGVVTLERARILEEITPRASYQALRALKESTRCGLMRIGDPLNDMGVKANDDGANVRLAIMDGGLALDHRDFVNRPFSAASFAPGESVVEGRGSSGHSTHCTGLAAGPLIPAHAEPRYGVAGNAYLLVGRIMRSGYPIDDCDLINALNWAFSEKADIIVLPIGARAHAKVETSTALEIIARHGLLNGHLLVAAAGDESSATTVQPVSHPANCRSIMAIGALNDLGNPAEFSCGRVTGGDAVDLCAPGETVRSSFPGNRIEVLSGTSAACSLAGGVAALWAAATGKRGSELWDVVKQNAKSKPCEPLTGKGLIYAP